MYLEKKWLFIVKVTKKHQLLTKNETILAKNDQIHAKTYMKNRSYIDEMSKKWLVLSKNDCKK